MSQDHLSVEQLLSALQRKSVPLPFEIGTFLVLQAAEQALVLEATEQGMAAPPCIGPADVWLTSDGEVSVVPSRAAGAEREACRALVVMLGDLLVRSAPGVPPMLLEIVEHGPSDGEWTLMRLRDDLEASLVPLNRGALRRVLARLLREVRRDVDRAPAKPPPDARTVDRDVDALFGIEAEQVPESQRESEPPPARDAALRSDDSGDHRGADRDERLAYADDRPARRRPRAHEAAAPRLDPRDDGFDDLDRGAADGGRGWVWLGIAIALLAAVLVGALLLVGCERSRSMPGLGFISGVRIDNAGTGEPYASGERAARLRDCALDLVANRIEPLG